MRPCVAPTQLVGIPAASTVDFMNAPAVRDGQAVIVDSLQASRDTGAWILLVCVAGAVLIFWTVVLIVKIRSRRR